VLFDADSSVSPTASDQGAERFLAELRERFAKFGLATKIFLTKAIVLGVLADPYRRSRSDRSSA
jgi:hypothetical protein